MAADAMVFRSANHHVGPMLHINDLTYRIEGRLLFDKATAGIPDGS